MGFVTEKGSPMRRSIIILVSVLALVTSACGGDITEDEFKDQLMEDGLVDETQAQCIVDGLGDAGISLQSVTDEELGDDPLPAAAAAARARSSVTAARARARTCPSARTDIRTDPSGRRRTRTVTSFRRSRPRRNRSGTPRPRSR